MNEIINGEGLKIVDNKLYINGDAISLECNLPGIDNSKVIISIPDVQYELHMYTRQEIFKRKLERKLRREERNRQRDLRRTQKKHRFPWFWF